MPTVSMPSYQAYIAPVTFSKSGDGYIFRHAEAMEMKTSNRAIDGGRLFEAGCSKSPSVVAWKSVAGVVRHLTPCPARPSGRLRPSSVTLSVAIYTSVLVAMPGKSTSWPTRIGSGSTSSARRSFGPR